MKGYVFPPNEQPIVPVSGGGAFPVRRIFCVGKNYVDHVREMGGDPKNSLPIFFTKPADAVHLGGALPFPQATSNLHYEGELVVALKSGGIRISEDHAGSHIFGYATGCDLTRRDLQSDAKQKGRPWDTAKALDHGAVVGNITPIGNIELLEKSELQLSVNGEVKQSAPISAMIWPVNEIISKLSDYFELKAGDLIYTGTPEGVGVLSIGDVCSVSITGLDTVTFNMSEAR